MSPSLISHLCFKLCWPIIIINNKCNKIRRVTKTLYLLQSHKFSNENIQATLACPKCEEIFKKEFPLDLEGQIREFKCPVCNSASEADLPSKGIEQQKEFEGDLYEVGDENIEEEIDESI